MDGGEDDVLNPDEGSTGLPQCRYWWMGGKGLGRFNSQFLDRYAIATNLSRGCSHKLPSGIQHSDIPCIQSSYLHVVSFVLGDAFAMQAMDLAIDIACVKPIPVVQSLCMTFPHRTRQY